LPVKVFIVYAHPEPRSFNGALVAAARSHLLALGHQVEVSDLYAMDWEARSGRGNFTSTLDPAYFKQQLEEAHAAETSGFSADIAAEIEKLLRCDVLILQFPMWWFSMPAILKGWVDRVFAMGVVYGGGRWYDQGGLAGRRAMVSMTVGGWESMYSPQGINGDIEQLLFPINHGILRFAGFDVLPPFIAWKPARISAAERLDYFDAYRERLSSLDVTQPLAYHAVRDYDPNTLMLPAPERLEAAD
jgi:NAD(P)H dehydrogenase (quinone)